MTTRLRHARTRPVALLACALLATGSAQAQQFVDLPGTQPHALDDATPLDDARTCGVTCHFSRDPTMPTTMPYDGWSGSMMGNTMRDPLYLAALTVAEQDSPGVGDWCLRCHTPPGFVGGRTRSSATAPLGADLTSADREGVTCDSCHRMVDPSDVDAGTGNGQYEISPTDTRFGPYPVINSIRHPGAQSTWLPQARMCATCHEIANPQQPQRLADGTDTGRRFPLDTTYSEWSRSDYAVAGSAVAATCQDCHMPRAGAPGYVSTNNTAMLRDNPRRHSFAGANAWGLRVLAAMRNDVASGEFYDPDSVAYYENGAQRAEQSLRGAVSLEVRDAPTTSTPGASVSVTARITNLTGHRAPTGYADGRRIWLEVAIVDTDNHETVVSGAYDDAQAHLDTTDPQLKLYAADHGRAGTGVEEHIALHDTVVRDTRLPPRGYHPLPGHEPVGADYSGGENGALRHWDDARYTFTLPASVHGPVRVRVRARYQVTTREYVEFLAAQNHTDDRGRDLLTRYEASGRAAPFNMAETTAVIMTPELPGHDAGVTDDAGSVTDAGATDAGALDAGPTPAQASGGCSCHTANGSSAPSGGYGALGLALAAVWRSRRRRS